MAKVAIVMGSDSDMPVMSKAADFLDQMGIDYEMTIISAESLIFSLNGLKELKKEELKLLLQEQERQHTFRVCAQHYSQCLLLEYQ